MKENRSGSVKIGVDIGGTFTDVVILSDRGELSTLKVPSTVDDYSRAIIHGLSRLLSDHSVEALIHATTVATNAVLMHQGAKTGLVTTRGFRDVLEIGRL